MVEDLLFLNKYKPLSVNDFSISDEQLSILNVFVNENKLPNIMICGKGGSGKTSMLNVIIHQYYQNYPISKYMDNIIQLTTIKDHGINYLRTNVKIFCQTASTIKGKKKIITVDDIDLMNEQIQHMIKYYIEIYSANVCFILTSTNIRRILDSILSRIIVINFDKPKAKYLLKIIQNIKKIENIQITPEAEKFIVSVSDQNIHAAINYLDKFKLYGDEINYSIALNMCTNIQYEIFQTYITSIRSEFNQLSSNLNNSIHILFEIFNKGYSVMDILDSFFSFIKITDMLTEDEKYNIVPIICKYIVIFHNLNESELQLALFTNDIYKILHV